MKSKMLLTICSVLVLMLLRSVPAQAQAEIDPDHFETPNVKPASRATMAAANQAPGSFLGSVTLPHEVNCAGRTLAPGAYSLSIHSPGGSQWVTLIPNGTAAGIQVQVESLSGAGQPTALIVERAGQQRTLTGISLQEPGMTLYLQGQPSRGISAESELVPISHVSGWRVGK